MQQLRPSGFVRASGALVLLSIGLGVVPALQAQTPAAEDPKHSAAAERAQREADKVFKWILIHADKPKRGADTKPAAAAVPAPKPAARAKDEGIVERVTPLVPPAASRADSALAAKPAASPTSARGQAGAPAEQSAGAATAPASAAPPSEALALSAPSSAAPASKPAPEPEVDVQLVLVHQVDPDFPPAVVRRLQKGSVQVKFEVLPDGSVRQPEVVKTSSARLNTAAVEAVAQWRFQPLLRAQQGMVELVFDIQ